MSKFMLRHFHYFRWLWRFIFPPVLERAKRTKYRRHPTLVGILWIIHSSHVCRVRKMDKETRECGSCEYVFDTHHSNAWPASVLSQRGDAGMRENIRDARYRITHTLPHESIVTKKQKKNCEFSIHFTVWFSSLFHAPMSAIVTVLVTFGSLVHSVLCTRTLVRAHCYLRRR